MSIQALAALAAQKKVDTTLSASLSALHAALPQLKSSASKKAGAFLSLPLDGEIGGVDLSGLSAFSALVLALRGISDEQLVKLEENNLLDEVNLSVRTWEGRVTVSFFNKEEEEPEETPKSKKGSGGRRNAR